MEKSIEYLREENKQLKEDIEMLLKRERRIRNDIRFSFVVGLIAIIVLFISSF
jgi:hypothetical protein